VCLMKRMVRSRCGRHWEDRSSAGEIHQEVGWWAGMLWNGGGLAGLRLLLDSAATARIDGRFGGDGAD
jgi:hypothetical protein